MAPSCAPLTVYPRDVPLQTPAPSSRLLLETSVIFIYLHLTICLSISYKLQTRFFFFFLLSILVAASNFSIPPTHTFPACILPSSLLVLRFYVSFFFSSFALIPRGLYRTFLFNAIFFIPQLEDPPLLLSPNTSSAVRRKVGAQGRVRWMILSSPLQHHFSHFLSFPSPQGNLPNSPQRNSVLEIKLHVAICVVFFMVKGWSWTQDCGVWGAVTVYLQ